MIRIDEERALDLLEECVEERGEEYIYPRADGLCLYVHGAEYHTWNDQTQGWDVNPTPEEMTPGCMIGLALIKAGVPMEAFLVDGKNRENVRSLALSLRQQGVVNISQDARSIFMRAQDAQDGGFTWGQALDEAQRARPVQ